MDDARLDRVPDAEGTDVGPVHDPAVLRLAGERAVLLREGERSVSLHTTPRVVET